MGADTDSTRSAAGDAVAVPLDLLLTRCGHRHAARSKNPLLNHSGGVS
jgi:hypothetical protein